MDFGRHPPPRPARENIVPMINVVFLLLIFFLMTAQIAPPEPFEVSPPVSTSDTDAPKGGILYVSADGTLAYGDNRGEGVFSALSRAERVGPLLLRADGGFAAGELAPLLAKLRDAGVEDIELITRGAK